MHVATVAVPVIATLASAALARAFYVKNFGYCRTQAHALSDESVDQGEGRGDLREFCVIESCIVMHCSAD